MSVLEPTSVLNIQDVVCVHFIIVIRLESPQHFPNECMHYYIMCLSLQRH